MSMIRLLFTLAFVTSVTLVGRPLAQSSTQPQPIIDVHLHAYRPADWNGPSPNPVAAIWASERGLLWASVAGDRRITELVQKRTTERDR